MSRFLQNSMQKTILRGIALQKSPQNPCKIPERENPGFTSDFLIALVFLQSLQSRLLCFLLKYQYFFYLIPLLNPLFPCCEKRSKNLEKKSECPALLLLPGPHAFVQLYKQYVRPHLKFCTQAWSPWYQEDKTCL